MENAMDEVVVTKFTHGLIGPDTGFFAHVRNGGRIRAVTPPGCWGPMITPDFRGGHEVTQPVYVEDAKVGDALAIYIEKINVLSEASSSGTMQTNEAAFTDDPFVAKKCPHCGTPWPQSRVVGIGEGSIRCAHCGAEASPFHFGQGYTVAFDKARQVSMAVDQNHAESYAHDAKHLAALPESSQQYPILLYAAHALTGLPVRVEPCIGNIGTIPSRTLPDSHNAGDFGYFLVGAHHEWHVSEEELDEARTDAHLDCRDVREGAVLIVPVKVDGAGVYLGDAHSIMGRGEIAGHSIDITADITVRVEVIKGLSLLGPLLLPNIEDLPRIARPFSEAERRQFSELGHTLGIIPALDVLPVQFIGTGKNLNVATDNAVKRAARFMNVGDDEILNRATIAGEVQISRLPGVVQLSLQLPRELLEAKGLWNIAYEQYLTS
ncbi:acetamidase/formamidase family protein [Sulfobacillus sp. hq2]|uniref:acetamidase/formamidase family protein n=1 Tax=Sulfobacillus TaxID=28033 RepID=UPI000CCFF2B6|nr:acetamidase/formamidase family protein [Sulfobacillus sp. hq2]POB09870.1 acetamidase [Sulfobacillus sp. hq2]